ncbi:response regulator [Halobacteriovorax sp. HLS]|uniref:response regulator n=1 Tax=Halobacteriovorax sp. HLS TaxID=2234000 RepID=UPI000FDBEFB4|nr:response regulator [Halobacteriovorax sp. HLS]
MQILMVDDDSSIIDLYSVVVEPLCVKNGFHVAYSPKEAIELIEKIDFDLIICDFDMPPTGTGEEVFYNWKENSKENQKFMFFTSRTLRELAFYKVEDNQFYLQKPTNLKKYRNYINSVTKTDQSTYFPIAIYHFARWKKSKFPIYIKINNDKFIKVFNTEEEYDLDRLNTYIEKGQRFLYIQTKDENKFFDKYDYSTIFETEEYSYDSLKQNHHFLNSQVSMLGLTKQTLKTAQSTAEKIIQDVESKTTLFDLLQKAINSKDFTYDHSYLMVCICSYVCDQMSLDKSVLKKISTAALIHDVLIPTNRLALIHDLEPKKIEQLEAKDRDAILSHTSLSDTLSKMDDLTNEIQNLIEFHHSGIDDYSISNHKKDLSQLNQNQCIFLASHFVACEIYRHDYDLHKISDILTFSKYKFSSKNFDKIWHTIEYVFKHKLN